ncbi:putative transcription factor C2H2 family [Rosa chinensis]|uniref:RING-type E3 ubiquitin transferase n=1 Tax=Rosa chinensis TaxID=74649 RepID=A0A2P6QVG4_ROSCH|nr:putative transcription factor C2H2 family [Rosa chinensis]
MEIDAQTFSYSVTQFGAIAPRVLEMANEVETIIRFRSFDIIGISWTEAPIPVVYDAPELLTDRQILVRLSDVKQLSKRHVYAEIMAENLSSSYVPKPSQAPLIEKIFQVVEKAVPGVPINVSVTYVSVRFVDSGSTAGIGDVTLRLWGWQKPSKDEFIIDRTTLFKPIPVTKSFIEALEKLMPDSLEATVRETPCAICKEALDYFVAVEDRTDHLPMISRLPCSHIYHGDCTTLWLDRDHFCPVCRYPMPVVEAVGEPSRPSGRRRLHWPRIMISAVGMITATLLCRLVKRS